MKAKATVLMLVGFVFSVSFLFAREMNGPLVKRSMKGAMVRIDTNRPNLSEAQVIRSAQLRQLAKDQKEPTLMAIDKNGVTIDLVPGGGDIFDNWHVTFDTQADFDIFELTDPLGLGNDWMWNAADSSAWAPEPAVGTGRDEVIRVKIGVAKESDGALPYQVANLKLEITVDEGDPDDYLEVGLLEGPKWHRDDFGSHTAGDSVWWVGDKKWDTWGYGNRWLEYLDTNPIDLSTGTAAELSIYTAWAIEAGGSYGWDAATVFAISSTDADYDTWTEIVPDAGYTQDNMFAWNIHWAIREGVEDDVSPGDYTAGNHGGWGGNEDEPGGNWHTETFDLTSFIGETIIIRFALAGDECYSPAQGGCEIYPEGDGAFDGGWWLDSINVSIDGGANLLTDLAADHDGPGFEPEPWQTVDIYDATLPGTGSWMASYNVTRSIIGSWEDSLTVGFRAVYDADNTAAPDVGFKVNDALLQIYTRLEVDAGATFVDLVSAGDSTLMNNGYALVGETYTPVVTIQNFGLSDMEIWTAFLEIENAFGDLVYVESIYFYLNTLLMYPAFRDTFFIDWTIPSEGDYTVRAYFELFGGDDEPMNDAIEVGFHAYTTVPAVFDNFNTSTDSSIFADGWEYVSLSTPGDTNVFHWDGFGRGDNELWWYSAFMAADSIDETLISPAVDLTGTTGNALAFYQYLNNTADFGVDGAWTLNILGRATAGDAWTVLQTTNGAADFALRSNNYRLDISAFDGSTAFQAGFQFVMNVPDTTANTPTGYATIDDFAIYANADLTAPPAPAGLVAVSGDMAAELSWAPVTGVGVMYYSVYSQFLIPGCDLTVAVVDIVPDSWPGETSWDIAELVSGTVVADGDVDGGSACLPEGDYIFTLYDSFGDGMDGSYTVTLAGTVVIDVDGSAVGSFTSNADTFAVVGTTPSDPDTSAIELVTEESESAAIIPDLDNDVTHLFMVSATDFNGNEGVMGTSVSVVPADVLAPTAIEDLYAVTSVDHVHLTWTAPFESAVDEATTYDIRYSMASITDANFAAATAVPDGVVPTVEVEGDDQTATVLLADPAPGTEYYFAIKTTDEVDNVSALSNVASTDRTAPGTVVDLTISGPSTITSEGDILTLSWAATGDDGDVGTATAYEVRIAYSLTTLEWETASDLAVVVTPDTAGTMESVDLDPATLPIYPQFSMAIALIVIDDNGNESMVSNVAVWAPVLSIAGGRGIPTEYGISQNYPNPFNPTTRIEFALPEQANVIVKIYNLLGREVKELVVGEYVAGYHTVVWNATDNASNKVPSGIYFYRINAGKFSKTTKLVLLK